MYVLRHTHDFVLQGNVPVDPNSTPHYLYKSVSKHRQGWLQWQLTQNIEDARSWATEAGAAGYAERLHGQFAPEFIDTSEADGKAGNREAIYGALDELNRAVSDVKHHGSDDLTKIMRANEALAIVLATTEEGWGI